MGNQRISVMFITVLFVISCVNTVFSAEQQQNNILKIEPAVGKLLVAVGSKIVLDCYITVEVPISPSSLKWNNISSDKFIVNTRTDDKLTYHSLLTIESFTPDYKDTYRCSINLGGTPFESTIELIPLIENKNEVEFFYGNSSKILECTLNFNTTSMEGTFHEWVKDSITISQLKHSERFTDYKNGTLLIKNPVRTDAGLYVARYNITGVGGEKNQVTYECIVTFKAAPLVLDMAKSKNVVEGTTLHLECKIKGYPPANVTWLKNNETFQIDGERIVTESLADLDKLTVNSVSSSDGGLYTCVAMDKDGRKSSKSILVRVKDRLEWLWPVIGIFCEIIVLAVVIFVCSKVKKNDQAEKPADEREGLLQGSVRNREHDKHA